MPGLGKSPGAWPPGRTLHMPSLEQMIAAAGAHQQAGQLDQAEAVLRRAARRAPASADVTRALAAVLASAGKTDQALYFAQRGVQSHPGHALLHTTLGALLARSGRA